MAVEFFINLKFDCVATPFSYVGNAIVNGDFTICAGTGTIGNGLADHFWTSTPLGGACMAYLFLQWSSLCSYD